MWGCKLKVCHVNDGCEVCCEQARDQKMIILVAILRLGSIAHGCIQYGQSLEAEASRSAISTSRQRHACQNDRASHHPDSESDKANSYTQACLRFIRHRNRVCYPPRYQPFLLTRLTRPARQSLAPPTHHIPIPDIPTIPVMAYYPYYQPKQAPYASPYVAVATAPYAPASPMLSPLFTPHGSPYHTPSSMTAQLPPMQPHMAVMPMGTPAGATITIHPPAPPAPMYPSPSLLCPPLPTSSPAAQAWNELSIRACIKDIEKKIEDEEERYDMLMGLVSSASGDARTEMYRDLQETKENLDELKKSKEKYDPLKRAFRICDDD
jgi:hypothetical protein